MMERTESVLLPIKDYPLWGSCRLTLVILGFFGAMLISILRFNFSMAIVCMTDDQANESLEFNWNKSTQGYLLSAFFYGYICTQCLGGYFSDNCSGKICLLSGIFILSSSSVMMPFLARLDEAYVIVIRIVQGLVSGVAFPSLYNMFAVWSSTNERATLMSVVLSGLSLANVINLPFSASLCATIGWPAVFYVPGLIGLVWCLAFHFLCFSSPWTHPWISPEEQNFLCNRRQNYNHNQTRNLKTPFLQMVKSGPVHALWITHLCHAWCYYLMAVNLTLYGRDVLSLNVVTNGILSCLPYLGMFLMTFTAGLFDYFRKQKVMDLTNLRKIFTTLGMLIPASCLIALHLVSSENTVGNIVLLTIGMSGHHLAATGGYYLSHSDLAGPFSGTLFGMTNTMAQIPGFANALIVAHLTPNGSRSEWLVVFDIASGISILGAIIYLIFGKSDLQEWAKVKLSDTDNIVKEDNNKLLTAAV